MCFYVVNGVTANETIPPHNDYARPAAPCPTLTNCQLHHFGAHNLNGSAKAVWANLAKR